MPRIPQSSIERASWRGAGGDPRTGPRARRTKRILLSLFSVGGLLLAGYLIWTLLQPVSHTRLVCLETGIYDVPQAPSIPFVRQGARLFETEFQDRPRITVDSRDSFGNDLAQWLADQIKDPNDVLIVYVNSHGVVQDGKAALMGSDFGRSGATGLYGVADLLEALGNCRAKRKLLLVDAGSLEHDVRLGMVVNQFPRLLEAEVKKLPAASQLWVLCSHSLLERSHVSYRLARSLFAHFVVEGLGGKADDLGQRDNQVELAELCRYVHDHVAGWVWKASGESETQTPMLLRAGEGRVRVDRVEPGLFLAACPAAATKSKPQPAGADAPADKDKHKDKLEPTQPQEQTPEAEGKTGFRSMRRSGFRHGLRGARWYGLALAQGQPPGAAAPAAEGKAAPAADGKDAKTAGAASEQPVPPPREAQKTQSDTNGQPAAVEAPAGREPPVSDAASGAPSREPGKPAQADDTLGPVAWLDEWRLREEAQQPRGAWAPLDAAGHTWRLFNDTLLGYEQRLWAGDALSPIWRRTLARSRDELNRDLDDFEASEFVVRLPDDPSGVIVNALHVRNRLLFHLPYYVRWYADAARSESVEKPLFDGLSELLKQLPDYLQLFSQEEGSDGEGWLWRVEERMKRIEEQEQAVDQLFDAEIRTGASEYRLQDLLAVPLLTAQQRDEVFQRLSAAPTFPDAPPPEAGANDALGGLSWRRLSHWTELELKLSQIAADFAAKDPLPALRKAQRQAAALAQDTETRLAGFQAFGDELRKQELSLGDGFKSSILNKHDTPRLRQAETMLRLVDARGVGALGDVLRQAVADRSGVNPVLSPPLPQELVPLDFELSVNQTPRSDDDRTVEFQWRLQARRDLRGHLDVDFEFKPQELEVDWLAPDGKTPLAAGRAHHELALGADKRNVSQTYLVRPASKNVRQASLRFQVAADGHVRPKTVTFDFPESGELLWFVREYDPATGRYETGPQVQGSEIHSQVELPLFAKGETRFRLGLANPSGRPRKITCRFYRLPDVPKSGHRGWEQPWDQLHSLGSAQTLEFRQGQDELRLPSPAAPTPPPADKKPDEAAARPAPAAPAAGTPVHQGLLCKIEDSLQSEPKWLWIAPRARHPMEYLQEPTVRYDRREQLIYVEAMARKGSILPAEQARVDVEPSNLLFLAASKRQDRDKLTAVVGDEVGVLRVGVEPEPGREVLLFLNVDDYPRAFAYLVTCDGQHDSKVPWLRKSFRNVEIVEPPEHAAIAGDTDDVKHVVVRLRADAPLDAVRQGQCRIEVWIDGEEGKWSPRTFASDRTFEAALLPAEPPDVFAFRGRVGDLQTAFNLEAFPNQERTIMAECTVPVGDETPVRGSATAERKIILDNNPPQIELPPAADRLRVNLGQPIAVAADITDLSGVAEVKFGQEGEKEGEIKDPQTKLKQPSDGGKYRLAVPSEGMKPGRYTFVLAAEDVVKHRASRTIDVTVIAPDLKAMANAGKIVGRVVFGKRTVAVKVTLKGPKTTTIKTGADGKFAFEKLPPGEYELTAEAIIDNRERSATTKLKVEPPPAGIDPVTLELE